MKVCPKCRGEFTDAVTRCDACQVSLVSEEQARAARAPTRIPVPDGAGFVRALNCDDPFDAEAYVSALRDAGIPVFSRDRRRSAVDVLVTSGGGSFWEILVPADQLARAQPLIAARKQELESEQEGAARAAEEEEAATEGHEIVGETESDGVAHQWAERLAAAGISAILRARDDVELDAATTADPPATLVLVPREQLGRAREVLQQPA
jgi:hypothetical protein